MQSSGDYTEQNKRKENEIMKSKNETKVRKSARTRVSDLTPKKDTRGGRIPEAPRPDGGPDPAALSAGSTLSVRSALSGRKKLATN